MGRNTWESLGDYKPLPNRFNIVVSTNLKLETTEWQTSCKSYDEALQIANSNPTVESIWVCGGKKIYERAIKMESVYITGKSLIPQKLYITILRDSYPADTFIDLRCFESMFPTQESKTPFYANEKDQSPIGEFIVLQHYLFTNKISHFIERFEKS